MVAVWVTWWTVEQRRRRPWCIDRRPILWPSTPSITIHRNTTAIIFEKIWHEKEKKKKIHFHNWTLVAAAAACVYYLSAFFTNWFFVSFFFSFCFPSLFARFFSPSFLTKQKLNAECFVFPNVRRPPLPLSNQNYSKQLKDKGKILKNTNNNKTPQIIYIHKCIIMSSLSNITVVVVYYATHKNLLFSKKSSQPFRETSRNSSGTRHHSSPRSGHHQRVIRATKRENNKNDRFFFTHRWTGKKKQIRQISFRAINEKKINQSIKYFSLLRVWNVVRIPFSEITISITWFFYCFSIDRDLISCGWN